MRLVIQRVKKAQVIESGKVEAEIGRGCLVFTAIGKGDGMGDFEVAADKIAKLRLFPREGVVHDFQTSVAEVGGEILVIPNYTLYGDLSEGNRPYFGRAERVERAKDLYREFIVELAEKVGEGIGVKTGTFGEFMEIEVEFDGPVTIILEVKSGKVVVQNLQA